MAGHINGVQANIKLEAPLAEYVHCSSHVLNLVLNAACAVPEIRDMFATVREVTKFLNESAKRRIIVAESLGEEGGRSLVTMCETRFVERHDAILVFHKQLKYTLDALEKIAQGMTDRKAADTARSLVRALTVSTFIVALSCARKVMAVTMVLSRSLQKVNQDLYQSMQSVNYVASTLQKWRDDSQSIATGDADDAVDEWCSGPHGAFFKTSWR